MAQYAEVNGDYLEFPDDASPEVIDAAVASHIRSTSAPAGSMSDVDFTAKVMKTAQTRKMPEKLGVPDWSQRSGLDKLRAYLGRDPYDPEVAAENKRRIDEVNKQTSDLMEGASKMRGQAQDLASTIIDNPIETAKQVIGGVMGTAEEAVHRGKVALGLQHPDAQTGREYSEAYGGKEIVDHYQKMVSDPEYFDQQLKDDMFGVLTDSTVTGRVAAGKFVKPMKAAAAKKALTLMDPLTGATTVVKNAIKKVADTTTDNLSGMMQRYGSGLTSTEATKLASDAFGNTSVQDIIRRNKDIMKGNTYQKAQALQKRATEHSARIQSALKEVKGTHMASEVKPLLKGIIDEMKPMMDGPDAGLVHRDMRQIYDDAQALYNRKAASMSEMVPKYTADEIHKVQQMFNRSPANPYTENPFVKTKDMTSKQLSYKKWMGDLKSKIEGIVRKSDAPIDLAKENRILQGDMTLGRMMMKHADSGKHSLMNLPNIIIATGGMAGGSQTTMMSSLALIAGREFLASPQVQSAIGNTIYKMHSSQLDSIGKMANSGTITKAGRVAVDSVLKAAKSDLYRAAIQFRDRQKKESRKKKQKAAMQMLQGVRKLK